MLIKTVSKISYKVVINNNVSNNIGFVAQVW